MTKNMFDAELGRLSSPRRNPAQDVRHRLLFEPVTDSVVMPYAALAEGAWLCLIVATRRGPGSTGHLTLAKEQLATSSGRLVLDPDDVDGFACLLWPTRVFLRWPGGAFPVLAQLLVHELRTPGTVDVPRETLADRGRLASRLPNLRPPVVARMLDRLHRVGLLTAEPSGALRLTQPATRSR